MANYSNILRQIHNEKAFRTLPDLSQLLYFVVRTHPNMTAIGAYRATIEGMASERNWSLSKFKKFFNPLVKSGYVEYNSTASCIVIPDWFEVNKPVNPNVAMAWATYLENIPDCPLLEKHVERTKAFMEVLGEGFMEGFAKGLAKYLRKGFAKPFGDTVKTVSAIPEKEKEQEQEEEIPLTEAVVENSGIRHETKPESNQSGGGFSNKYSTEEKIKVAAAFFRRLMGYPDSGYVLSPSRWQIWRQAFDDVERYRKDDDPLKLFCVAMWAFILNRRNSSSQKNKPYYDPAEYLFKGQGDNRRVYSYELMESYINKGIERIRKGEKMPLVTPEAIEKAKQDGKDAAKARVQEEARREEDRNKSSEHMKKRFEERYIRFLANRPADNREKRIFEEWKENGLPDWALELQKNNAGIPKPASTLNGGQATEKNPSNKI